jgi:pseudouridine-5'-phosphate glycosidase
VGIRVFATGGIGGVHRGSPNDVSTDLTMLAETRLVVVCAGAKAILDLPATLERLETLGVPVVGYQTDEFPAFYSRSSGLPVSGG